MDVITLYSTKGGCGKTTLAAHLAVVIFEAVVVRNEPAHHLNEFFPLVGTV